MSVSEFPFSTGRKACPSLHRPCSLTHIPENSSELNPETEMIAFPPSVWSAEGSPCFVPRGPVRGTLMWSCSALYWVRSLHVLDRVIVFTDAYSWCVQSTGMYWKSELVCRWTYVLIMVARVHATQQKHLLSCLCVFHCSAKRVSCEHLKKKALHFLQSFWKIVMYTKSGSLIIPSVFEMMACLWNKSWTLENRTKEN